MAGEQTVLDKHQSVKPIREEMLSDSSSDASSIYRKQQVSAKPIPEFKLNALSPEEEQAKVLEEIRLKYLEDART